LGRAGRYAFGYYDEHPCYAPWTHSLIDFNGNVYVCCMTRERIPPMGNIKNQSFKEIWESAAYQRIRLKMHPPALSHAGGAMILSVRTRRSGRRSDRIIEKSLSAGRRLIKSFEIRQQILKSENISGRRHPTCWPG
jgi:hypothetical protein